MDKFNTSLESWMPKGPPETVAKVSQVNGCVKPTFGCAYRMNYTITKIGTNTSILSLTPVVPMWAAHALVDHAVSTYVRWDAGNATGSTYPVRKKNTKSI